jgi:preprotein translocase subunit SecF
VEFFKSKTHIDFMGMRDWAALFSATIVIFSLVGLGVRGIHWGLDFTGGTVVELSYPTPANIETIREALSSNGYRDAVVQYFGSSQDVLIRIAPRADMDEQTMGKNVLSVLLKDNPGVELKRSDVVGAHLGKELAQQGGVAILVALLGTMCYIALRFEWKFALGAGLALLHDPILILGVFSWTRFEFDLPTLAAILAVIGYSLNDTVVVFDRVKENFFKLRQGDALEIMNLSLNETLSRTIMTSFMTLLVVTSLLIYGGATLFGFSLALFIGIIVGTYSSIYIAGALTVALGLSRADLIKPVKEAAEDDAP